MGFIASFLIGWSITAHADVIADWNDKVVAAGVQARQPPYVHARSVAIVHVAMFEAVNAIDRRYTPYRVQVFPAAGTSREAPAAAAPVAPPVVTDPMMVPQALSALFQVGSSCCAWTSLSARYTSSASFSFS